MSLKFNLSFYEEKKIERACALACKKTAANERRGVEPAAFVLT